MENDTVKILSTVPFSRMCNLVNDITDLLFDDDGTYLPERYDYVFWVTISNAYAGVGLDMDADAFVQKLYSEKWMDKLANGINNDQLSAITAAVKKKVDKRLNENPMLPLIKSLTELIDGLNNKINDNEIQSLMDVVKNVKDINADSLVKAYINRK